jgi:hypothetical protein
MGLGTEDMAGPPKHHNEKETGVTKSVKRPGYGLGNRGIKIVQTSVGAYKASYSRVNVATCLRVNQPECKGNYLLLSSTEVKYKWSVPPLNTVTSLRAEKQICII